jgi:hypothetical protein
MTVDSAQGLDAGRPHFQLYTPASSSEVWWRLLSANNRDLGRSLLSYPDTETCIVALQGVIVALDALRPLVRRSSATDWRWQLCDDDSAIITAAHGYDRQVRCEEAARKFLQHAAVAVISSTLVMAGRRRWTGASGVLQPRIIESSALARRSREGW